MTLADETPLRDLADRALRDSLRHPENLRSFLQQAVPNLAEGFDCTRARLLEREFPLDDWRRREADLPFEIPYRVGSEEVWTLVCVLLEHQSDTDPLMPLRLLYFAVVYWDKQWHDWEQSPRPRPALHLRPVLPIVLYTGPRPWGSNRTLTDLLGEPVAFHAFAPVWQPLFWNLADQTPEELLQTSAEWLQTLAVIRVQNEEPETFAAVFGAAVQRLAELHGRDHVRWYDLMRIVLTYALWRRPEQERSALLAAAQANSGNVERQREIETMSNKLGPTIADLAWAKGEAKGEAKGLREGQLLARREDLRALLEDRFGPLPEELLQRIAATDDLERLQLAVRQGWRLEKLEDLQL